MRRYVKSEYSLVNIDLVTFRNVKKWAPGTVVAVMKCQFLRNDDWAKILSCILLCKYIEHAPSFQFHTLCIHLSTRNKDLIDPCATISMFNSRVKDRNLKYISSILFVTCGKRAVT